jgi:hypothetical protein
MFGINQKRLIENLEKLRRRCCCYMTIDDDSPCDCKYDPSEDTKVPFPIENNGCPEIRLVIKLLENMSDGEYHKFCKKGDIVL